MRIERLKKELGSKNIDLSLIFSLEEIPNTDMVYFANYSGLGVLVVSREKQPFLLAPEMEYEKALNSSLKVFKTNKKKKFIENLSDLLSNQKEKIKKIGLQESKCSLALYKRIKKAFGKKYTDVSSICSDIRMVKDNEELDKLRKACSVTDSIFKKIYSNFKFKTELQLKEFIENEIRENKCDLAFSPIVGSAEGTSQPHYVPTDKKLNKGFLLLDFGAKYKGYCADMTRMLYLGTPSKQELADYSLVLKVVIDCEEASEKRKKFSDLYKLSVMIFEDKSKYFIHSLGHGVGLDIHETPSLNAEDKTKIGNMIPFTIEPGIYFSGKYGIRIEDTVVLINNKLEVLTNSRKDLILI